MQWCATFVFLHIWTWLSWQKWRIRYQVNHGHYILWCFGKIRNILWNHLGYCGYSNVRLWRIMTDYWPHCVAVVLAARGRSVKAGRPQLRIPPFIAPYARFSQLSSALSTDSSLWCQFALKKLEEKRKLKMLWTFSARILKVASCNYELECR